MRTESRISQEFKAGWPVLLAATIGVGLGVSSLPFYTAGLFITPLREEFGWTRAAAGNSNMMLSLGIALAAPLAGLLMDRVGARIVAAAGLVFQALGFCLLAAMGGAVWAYAGIFFLIGALGAGASPLSFTRVVSSRFVQARGLALGICLMGTGLTAAIAPVLISPLIADHGWRTGYLALALAVVASIPFVLLLGGKSASAVAEPVEQESQPFTHFLAERRFWLLAFSSVLAAASIAGIVIHLTSIVIEKGASAADAAAPVTTIGVAVIVARLATGAALDRWRPARVGAVIMIMASSGALILHYGPLDATSLAAFVLGVGVGAEVDLISYLCARYFGLRAYGRAYGMIYGATLLAAGLGPLAVGAIADQAGPYGDALIAGAVCLAIAAALLLLLPDVERHRTRRGPGWHS